MRKKILSYLCHNTNNYLNIFCSKKSQFLFNFSQCLRILRATLQENYMLYKYITTAAKPVIIECVKVFLLYNHK